MDWKLRAKVFLQRLWQPTCACMTCMSAPSFVNVVSAVHWKIALQTGVATGILALLLTLTPVGRLFGHRYGNALMVGGLTVVADAWSQAGLMAREDLSPGSQFATVLATPSISGAFFEWRAGTNNAATRSGTFPVNYPNTWLAN